MNVFLVGGDAGRAAAALESLRSPFLGDGVLHRLPDGAALCHPPERVGGVEYVAQEGGRYALFCGRPILWDGDDADGRATLDASRYLRGVPSGLDGRYAVVADGQVHLDPLGAYPVWALGDWLSNWPAALIAATGGEGVVDPAVVASVVGGGWSLSGDPLAAGISRVPWSAPEVRPGSGFDAGRSARLLVAAVRALGDWPGRPNVVLATGGRDSRLIVAAAVRAGIDMEVRTGGTEEMEDVVIGRRLAAAVGVPHRMLDPHPFGSFEPHWREMARTLAATTGGTATLADAAGFPLVGLDGPLPLWHTGQGGEIARGYYGNRDLLDAFLARRPGRTPPLNGRGEGMIREALDGFGGGVERGDLFYLHQRMARWAAPTHAAVEPVRDSTSALWSWKLLPEMLGLPAHARAHEEFHLRVLEELAPELVDLPFEGGRPWPSRQSGLARRATRAKSLAGKAAGVARRRWATFLGSQPGLAAHEPWWDEMADTIRGSEGHAAWEVLDRRAVDALLAKGPGGWDAMERSYVLRLATVFGGFPAGPAAQ